MSKKVDILPERLAAAGLGGKLARFYLAALELGEASVHDVARHCGVSRTTAYALFDKLLEDGLVTQVNKGGRTRVIAENPDVLLRNMDDKRTALAGLLPDLKAIYGHVVGQPRFRIYEGVEGIRSVLNAVLLTETETLRGILSMKELLDFPGQGELERFIEKRVEAGINLRVIRSASEDTAGIWNSSEEERREVRFTATPEPLRMTSFICDDKVAMISSKRENYGLIIDSVELARVQGTLFEALWISSRQV